MRGVSTSAKLTLSGSTNTDGVVIDPARSQEADRGIIAWYDSFQVASTFDITPAMNTHFDAYLQNNIIKSSIVAHTSYQAQGPYNDRP
jgi:hypothetical protein